MLSPKRDIPLPHAMTDEVEVDGKAHAVRRSFVRLEIENSSGEVITVHRSVRDENVDSRLVSVFHGPVITESLTNQPRQDYFVRMPGAAQRSTGFHHFLADFVGWAIPRVTKTDGSEVPLYAECLFPYSFVEQKQGWLSVQPRIPGYFQIRDAVRRSAEFTLNLDAYNLALRRQRLEYAKTVAESDWKARLRALSNEAASVSVTLRNVPANPAATQDGFKINALVAQPDKTWSTLEEEISRLQDMLEEVAVIPNTGPASEDLEADLSESQDRLVSLGAVAVEAIAEHDAAQQRATHLRERVVALEEDLQRHKDAALLTRLGSSHSALFGENPHCPTCSQFLPDGFDITVTPMAVDDNIKLIEQELITFKGMLSDSLARQEVEATKVRRLRGEANLIRAHIRSLKDTLTAPSSMPSIAAIAQQVRLEEHIGVLLKFSDEVRTAETDLVDRAQAWRVIDEELKAAGRDTLSILDREKIHFINESFRDQLRAYQFSSMAPENVTISEDTYRPVHEGFDLGFDLSASDMIRALWAYLLSFAEVSLKHATNHLGVLVLDEPRQQEVHRRDFATFLRRLGRDGSDGLQVIVATSEEDGSLTAMLGDTPHTMISLSAGSKVIRPLR
ncbi:hypothetical protein J2S41_005159 [Catenuloplanes atrovinosus]|uniref:Uncharacterized protein n=2 Tax=Catenuloplanes atrovinosus TaxID=137266 RepID=A0AAE4CB73_9ACTN|nr:hypothetical protein [Catenuloplanes atrovinosus]